jgi:AraC family transcriptional regulator
LNWIERLQNALEFLEKNIEKDLSPVDISGKANTTPFHFQRMFSIITGVPLAEYIRKRRLTLAAQELVSKNSSIVDVALKYGYATQASFTRAFNHFHGFSPGMIREQNITIRSYLPVSFQISITGEVIMDYEIKETGPVRLIGEVRKFTNKDGLNLKEIPKFWQGFSSKGLDKKLIELAEGKRITGKTLIGVCMDFSENQEEFEYMIGIESAQKEFPEVFVERVIPSSTWAIFKSGGSSPESIQKLEKRIYSEWFPSTKYIHAGSPELELYYENDDFEIWIPIKKE